MLTMYHMYGMEGYSEEDDNLAPEDDPAIQGALVRVREWSWNGEWRVGEEWIGDLLYAFIQGNYQDAYIPWSD